MIRHKSNIEIFPNLIASACDMFFLTNFIILSHTLIHFAFNIQLGEEFDGVFPGFKGFFDQGIYSLRVNEGFQNQDIESLVSESFQVLSFESFIGQIIMELINQMTDEFRSLIN